MLSPMYCLKNGFINIVKYSHCYLDKAQSVVTLIDNFRGFD